ncbi:MAG TPA: class II aldolase/adducin family protein [Polyangia bacterium]|jgi:L-fuculose-phosphate aldolase
MAGFGTEARLREALCDYSRRLHARGWVANHDGNLSVRAGAARVLCTPTATSKAAVGADGIVLIESLEDASRVVGRGKPPGEVNLHLCAYRARPDVRAVVHAHPPTATAIGLAGSKLLERPLLPEAVVSLGPCVPTVPVAAPGKAAAAALAPFLCDYDAVLIAGNGVLAVGDDLEQAYLRLELVEHLARIALAAHQLGATPGLPAELLPALLESRRKAGLGPEARKPAAPAAGPRAAGGDEVARLVREELVKALGKA